MSLVHVGYRRTHTTKAVKSATPRRSVIGRSLIRRRTVSNDCRTSAWDSSHFCCSMHQATRSAPRWNVTVQSEHAIHSEHSFARYVSLVADNGVFGALSAPRPASCSAVSLYTRRESTRLATADAPRTRVNDMRPFKIEGCDSGLYIAFTVYQVFHMPSTKRLLRLCKFLQRRLVVQLVSPTSELTEVRGFCMPVKYTFVSCFCSVAESARGRKADSYESRRAAGAPNEMRDKVPRGRRGHPLDGHISGHLHGVLKLRIFSTT